MTRKSLANVPYLLLLLALAGLSISAYLTVTHLGDQPIACAGIGSCDYVNNSDYASIGPVPVSLLGMGLYLLLIASSLYWLRDQADETRGIAYWGLALAGVSYAGYLTYVEVAVLQAICVWCVASAILLASGFILATLDILALE